MFILSYINFIIIKSSKYCYISFKCISFERCTEEFCKILLIMNVFFFAESQVSWVRGRDIRLLTIGLITYTSDKRFVSSNPARGQDWFLKIHYTRKQDAGSYLCQVSTSPPITRTVYLHVNGKYVVY